MPENHIMRRRIIRFMFGNISTDDVIEIVKRASVFVVYAILLEKEF